MPAGTLERLMSMAAGLTHAFDALTGGSLVLKAMWAAQAVAEAAALAK
jgi:hypothetical protein